MEETLHINVVQITHDGAYGIGLGGKLSNGQEVALRNSARVLDIGEYHIELEIPGPMWTLIYKDNDRRLQTPVIKGHQRLTRFHMESSNVTITLYFGGETLSSTGGIPNHSEANNVAVVILDRTLPVYVEL